MAKENIIQEKSFAFALKTIAIYKKIINNHKEFVLSRQLLKSGTSIGANVEEAIGAQSKADFISKINISYKEARESLYWIRLLIASDYLNANEDEHYKSEAEEIKKILAQILKTSKGQ